MVCIWISDLFCLSALSVLTAMASEVKHPLISRTDTDHKQRRLPKSLQKEQAHLCRVSVIWALTQMGPSQAWMSFGERWKRFGFSTYVFHCFFLPRLEASKWTRWNNLASTRAHHFLTSDWEADGRAEICRSWASLPPAFCDKSHESSHGFKWTQQAMYSWSGLCSLSMPMQDIFW